MGSNFMQIYIVEMQIQTIAIVIQNASQTGWGSSYVYFLGCHQLALMVYTQVLVATAHGPNRSDAHLTTHQIDVMMHATSIKRHHISILYWWMCGGACWYCVVRLLVELGRTRQLNLVLLKSIVLSTIDKSTITSLVGLRFGDVDWSFRWVTARF